MNINIKITSYIASLLSVQLGLLHEYLIEPFCKIPQLYHLTSSFSSYFVLMVSSQINKTCFQYRHLQDLMRLRIFKDIPFNFSFKMVSVIQLSYKMEVLLQTIPIYLYEVIHLQNYYVFGKFSEKVSMKEKMILFLRILWNLYFRVDWHGINFY